MGDGKQKIDQITEHVHRRMPEVEVIRLAKKRDNDDDNLWWFSLPGIGPDVQVEGDDFPFLVETDAQSSRDALKARTVEEAAAMIVDFLSGAKEGRLPLLSGEPYWSSASASEGI